MALAKCTGCTCDKKTKTESRNKRLIDALLDSEVEYDPKAKMSERHNEGKIDYTLIPPEVLKSEAEIWTAAQKEYPPAPDGTLNWQIGGKNATVAVAAKSAYRHLMAILSGEHIDPKSGFPHAAHLRCNGAMMQWYYERDQKELLKVPKIKRDKNNEKTSNNI